MLPFSQLSSTSCSVSPPSSPCLFASSLSLPLCIRISRYGLSRRPGIYVSGCLAFVAIGTIQGNRRSAVARPRPLAAAADLRLGGLDYHHDFLRCDSILSTNCLLRCVFFWFLWIPLNPPSCLCTPSLVLLSVSHSRQAPAFLSALWSAGRWACSKSSSRSCRFPSPSPGSLR